MQVLQLVVLSNAEDNTSGSLNRGGIADLPSFQEPRAKFLGSDEIFCFIFLIGQSKLDILPIYMKRY